MTIRFRFVRHVAILLAGALSSVSSVGAASPSVEDWPVVGHDYAETRFSPLSAIDEHNVSRLHLVWYHDLDTHRGQEATPVVIDGVMYTSSAWSKVQAFEAASGKLLWQYDPKVPGAVAIHVCCDVVNRGVAVSKGRVFVGTLDGRLIALNARTGKPVWSVSTVDGSKPYSVTGAPLVVDGRVIIGNAGAEYGVRGYISAYAEGTGKRLWRFYTVPDNPAKGFENAALRKAAGTWSGEWWKEGGGGTVWNSLSYDPDLGLIYFGTGNAEPWSGPVGGGDRGDALYTASIMAVRARDGAYVWHYQTTPGDIWDYDATQTLSLATLNIGGQPRRVVMQGNKNGFFYVLDRVNGSLLAASAFEPMNWSTGVDLSTGRPVVNPDSHYDKTGKLWVAAPGGLGAHNWHAMSFSPQTGLAYIPAQELPFPFLKDPDYKHSDVSVNMGIDLASTSLPQDPKVKAAISAGLKGELVAWDPVAGKAAWRAPHPGPWNGGLLSTGGNLVFQGTAAGEFLAYRASDGEQLWSFPAQTGIIAAPMTYSVNGRQYVTIVAGWGGVFPLVAGELAFKSGRIPNRSRVLTFALDGQAALPEPIAVAEAPLNPPQAEQPKERVASGAKLYPRYCGSCHGDAAYSGGLLPDLRHTRALADDALWSAIVERGALQANGMIAFGKALGKDRLGDIRAYLIFRAQQSAAADHAP
jgi:alcohol dehydrogenase (cytochrome c)/quinohemoprotein ethanol dehydrogenase